MANKKALMVFKNYNAHQRRYRIFPPVRFTETNTVMEQLKHLISEIVEIIEADNDEHRFEEIVDTLHSAESLVRVAEREYGFSFLDTRNEVIEKNYNRGHYGPVK